MAQRLGGNTVDLLTILLLHSFVFLPALSPMPSSPLFFSFAFSFFCSIQPEELTDVLEISNIVFTSMFVLEMGFMLLAFGLFGYIRNPYNIFDSIIVIIRQYLSVLFCLHVEKKVQRDQSNQQQTSNSWRYSVCLISHQLEVSVVRFSAVASLLLVRLSQS